MSVRNRTSLATPSFSFVDRLARLRLPVRQKIPDVDISLEVHRFIISYRQGPSTCRGPVCQIRCLRLAPTNSLGTLAETSRFRCTSDSPAPPR